MKELEVLFYTGLDTLDDQLKLYIDKNRYLKATPILPGSAIATINYKDTDNFRVEKNHYDEFVNFRIDFYSCYRELEEYSVFYKRSNSNKGSVLNYLFRGLYPLDLRKKETLTSNPYIIFYQTMMFKYLVKTIDLLNQIRKEYYE